MATHANITRRSILKTAGAMGLVGSGITAAVAAETGHPDAALLLLGEKLDMEQSVYDMVLARFDGDVSQEADDACLYAHEQAARVAAGIESMSARTVDGLRVKARAIQWCFGTAPVVFGDGNTTDVRLAAQIIQALLEA